MKNRESPKGGNYARLVILAGTSFTIFLLQLASVFVENRIEQKTGSSSSDGLSLLLSLLGVALTGVSGILLSFLLLSSTPMKGANTRHAPIIDAFLLSVLPAIGIILKLMAAMSNSPFRVSSPLRPFLGEMWDWTLFSQAPSLWLGLIIGWLVWQHWVARGSSN